MGKLKVTSLDNLKKIAQGEVVELPSFIEGEPFYARVRRPSIMSMVTKGDIPNSLMSTALELFYGKMKKESNPDFKKMTEIQDLVVKSALLEPTVDELNEIGLQLTDEQSLAIFNYTQQGVQALERFRKEQATNTNIKAVEKV